MLHLYVLALPGALLHAGGLNSACSRMSVEHFARSASIVAQSGPLEEGYRELLPMRTQEGTVDQEIVDRMNEEVLALTGRPLEDLLNPSKVVNLEYQRIQTEQKLSTLQDTPDNAIEIKELEAKLDKVASQLYSEKRTVFRGWLKNVFVGQSLIAASLSGLMAFDALPVYTIDISLRALAFWSWWLFIIPSLRARRPRGWEKKSLDIAFLGSPIITLGLPFLTKDPGMIWSANCALVAVAYIYGLVSGDEDAGEQFEGPLAWLDFGSGRERGMSSKARESYSKRSAEMEKTKETSEVQ